MVRRTWSPPAASTRTCPDGWRRPGRGNGARKRARPERRGRREGGAGWGGRPASSAFAGSPRTPHGCGAPARAVSQGSGTLCGVIATTFTDTRCATADDFGFVVFPSPLPSEWTQANTSLRTSAAVVAAQLELFCASDPSVIAVFDDAFFGEGLVPVELQAFSREKPRSGRLGAALPFERLHLEVRGVAQVHEVLGPRVRPRQRLEVG